MAEFSAAKTIPWIFCATMICDIFFPPFVNFRKKDIVNWAQFQQKVQWMGSSKKSSALNREAKASPTHRIVI
jgi:hypothetical protein